MKHYIVTSGGGLGNQIMQYALWLYLKEKGNKASLVLRVNDIRKIFPNADMPPVSLYDNLLIRQRNVIRFFFNTVSWIKERKKSTNNPSFLNKEIVDFPLWNDYTFIRDINERLRNVLSFPSDEEEKNIRVKKKIEECNSVSIHVRRGDYQSSIYWRMALGDICNKRYYEKAIEKVRGLIPNPVFFVFSDDIEWVMNNLDLDSPIYIDWNKGENSFRDMELMSYCKVNIIANSTFSLCASYLNVNNNPIIIAPTKWRNRFGDKLRDIYLKDTGTMFIDNNWPQVTLICKTDLTSEDIYYLRRQSYTDFEVITKTIVNDNRFHEGEIQGRIVFEYTKEMIPKFRNRHFLGKWVKKIYKQQPELDYNV